MKVDAHHHLWNPARGDYGWMPKDNPILHRTYRPSDMSAALFAAGIEKTILVQAAPTVDETEYMLGLADGADFVGGVVGWVDFASKQQRETLERLAGHPLFKGVRPMIQDIPDDDWMLGDDIRWAFDALTDLDLTFDALGFPRHLKNFATLLQRYPDLRVVVDHCMKPDIANHSESAFSKWADGMTRIAETTGACCKLSGLVTEAGENWTIGDLRPYAEHVIAAFGPSRVMWGSDWPVVRLRAEYDAWHSAARSLTAHLSNDDQALIFGGTAARFYRIDE